MSLFDERDLVEITSNAYPGERLCRNPLLDRARKRQELLEATEARTDCRSDATSAGKIGERKVIGRMTKHFTWSIDDDDVFTYGRDEAAIAAEARLLYVVRLPQSELDGPARLQAAELRGTGLPQPQGPEGPSRLPEPRVRVFLCMLAYYVEWHMRLKPMLFDDEDAEGGRPLWRRQKSRRAPGPRRQRRGRPEGAQLPHPHRRSCHPQHRGAPPCGRRTLPGHHMAHAAPEKGIQAPGREAIVYRDR